jgi:hypothetical protein
MTAAGTFALDTNTYALSSALSNYVTLATAQTISGAKTFTSNIQLGSIGVGTGSATPLTINLGDTFSNTAGSALKLRLFQDTDSNIYGIGVSSAQMDFNIPATAQYKFWSANAIFTNNVGIGGVTPNSALVVKASGATNSIRLGSIAADTTYNGVILNGSIADGVYVGISGGGGVDNALYVNAGNAGNIVFRNGNGSAFTNRMLLNEVGNLGLGIDAPNFAETGRKVLDINGTSNSIIALSVGGTAKGYIYHSGTFMSIANFTTGNSLNFNTRTAAGVDTTKVSINSEGIVGVGTSSQSMPVSTRKGLVIRGASAELGLQTTAATDGAIAGFALVAAGDDSYYVNRLSGSHIFNVGDGNTEKFRMTSAGMMLFNTDTPSASLGGTVVTVRASSANVGQTAFSIQDYLKRGRWAFNGQNGNDNYDYAIYSAPTGAGDWTQRFTIQQDGIVHIGGTVSGGGRLQVNGDVNINGNFKINGTTIGGGGGSGVTGSGTANYATKWTGASTLGNSQIYDNGSNVIIGATSGTNDSKFEIKGSGVWQGAVMTLTNTGTSGKSFSIFSTNTSFTQGASRILFYNGTDNVDLGIITNTGNWIFGSITDNGAKLQVTGTATFSSSVTASGGFFDSSDSRLKIIVKDYEQPKGIENVSARMYVKNGKKELGYFAQDLQEILPSAVSEGQDGFLTLSYSQVHTAKIAYLEKEVAELKQLIKTLL